MKKGALRVSSKNLKVYRYSGATWRPVKVELADLMDVVKLFKAHGNFGALVSEKDSGWLKGYGFDDGAVLGERIGVLPNGEKLDKAFSLFARGLTIHDEANHGWDVLFQNASGSWSYCYSLKKKTSHVKSKYEKVARFERIYPRLRRNVLKGLERGDDMSVAMMTLFETLMRVGNESYYLRDGHKGLTTLKRGDIKIRRNLVEFNFVAKDGVPQVIVREFPLIYIKRLRALLRGKRKNDFVFVNALSGHPLKDVTFEKAFVDYCGEKFYPHIVRSFYATKKVEDFLAAHRGKVSWGDVEDLFVGIAERLGHKKFSKKKGEWEICYKVTMDHYVNPKLVKRVEGKIKF